MPESNKETEKVSRKPSLGRIVLYHYRWSRHSKDADPLEAIPAIITAVHVDGSVALCTFGHTGATPYKVVPFAEKPTQDHWSWPPQV